MRKYQKYQYFKLSVVFITSLVWGRLAFGLVNHWIDIPEVQTTTEIQQSKG